jgi:hypothetical protein
LTHCALPTEGIHGWIGRPAAHAKALIQSVEGSPSFRPFNTEVLINPTYWDFRHLDVEVGAEYAQRRGPSKVELKFILDSPLNDGNWVRSRGIGEKLSVFVQPNEQGSQYGGELVTLRNRIFDALGVPHPSGPRMSGILAMRGPFITRVEHFG